MSQSLTLPVAGLMTDPGPFTASPDGGLLEAENVVVMRPGVIEPRQGTLWVVDTTLKAGGYEAHALYSDPADLAFVWALVGSTWIIRRSPTTITGPTAFTRGKIRICPTGGRALFTSDQGIASLPSQLASPTAGSSAVAYRAGMPQPAVPVATATILGTIATGRTIRFRFTLRRTLANGTIVESPPSSPLDLTTTTNGAGWYFSGLATTWPYQAYQTPLALPAFQNPAAGDALCVYRTTSVASGTDPGDELRLRMVLPYNTTFQAFVDPANPPAPWQEKLQDTGWNGAPLYTNAGREGAAMANYRPEYARDATLYNGMTFYAGARSAEQLTLTMKIGATAANAQETFSRGGSIQLPPSLGITIGSPIITGVLDASLQSIGQVIQTQGTSPLVAAAFPPETYVIALNAGAGTITMSANALVTSAVADLGAWDWIDIATPSLAERVRLYAALSPSGISSATVMTFDTGLVPGITEGEYNGQETNTPGLSSGAWWRRVQARVTSADTGSWTWQFFTTDPSAAAFNVKSSKPQAFSVYTDSITGTTSKPTGGVAELQWSKLNEPEHCPLPYRTVVGDAAYAIRRVVVARNSLLILKDDGLYQCFGQTPDSLTFELLDRTITLPAPATYDEQSKWVDRFDDRIVAMTTRGPMVLSDAGGEVIGAPILESMRRAFAASFGALDDALRAMMVDVTGRRVGYVWNIGSPAIAVGYVVDMETGTWTYWTWRRQIGAFATRSNPSAVAAGFGVPVSPLGCAGSYLSGIPYSDRTMLDDASVTLTTMPRTYEDVFTATCTITSVTGTGPSVVVITAGSEWTPTVGDILIQAGVSYEVTRVTSATSFTVEGAPAAGAATWREGYPIRVIWLGRAEGNTTADKTLQSIVYTLENSTLVKGMKYYVRGYRNQNTASTGLIAASGANGASPWAMVPEFERWDVPRAHASDWAHRVGFTITRAGVWFSTAGISVIFVNADPDAAGGRRR